MTPPDGWGRNQAVLGHWEVEALSVGPYDVTVTFANPVAADAMATIAFRGLEESVAVMSVAFFRALRAGGAAHWCTLALLVGLVVFYRHVVTSPRNG